MSKFKTILAIHVLISAALVILIAAGVQVGREVVSDVVTEQSLHEVSTGENTTRTISCEVEPLDDHGFAQMADNPEYVCVNPDDFTDFVVVEDKEGTFELGDVLSVTFLAENPADILNVKESDGQ